MHAFCMSAIRIGHARRLGLGLGLSARRPVLAAKPRMMIRGFPNNFEGGGKGTAGKGGTGAFDALSYPCVFTFKVIGIRQGDFHGDIVDSCAAALDTDRKNVKTTFRDHGKWRSLTLRAAVANPQQIYACYAAFDRDPRVKFKF